MKNLFYCFVAMAFLGIGTQAMAGGHGQVLRVVQPQFVVVQPQAFLVNPYAVQQIVVQDQHFAPQRIVVQRQRVVVQQQRVVVQRQFVRQRAGLEIRGPFGGRISIR